MPHFLLRFGASPAYISSRRSVLSLKFEAFAPGIADGGVAVPHSDAMDDDDEGVPRPPSPMMTNDASTLGDDSEIEEMADLDESDAGVELKASQLVLHCVTCAIGSKLATCQALAWKVDTTAMECD